MKKINELFSESFSSGNAKEAEPFESSALRALVERAKQGKREPQREPERPEPSRWTMQQLANWDAFRAPFGFKEMANPKETAAIKAVRAFRDDREKNVLVLSGRKGTGKSFAAAWWLFGIACAFSPTQGRHATRRWLNYAELCRFENRQLVAEWGETPKIVLDDLGIGGLHERERERLEQLLAYRFQSRPRRRMVITTNFTLAALREHLGERIWDRVEGGALVWSLAGESLRGANG